MKVTGTVFTGVSRGEPLIELHKPRIKGLIGYEPLSGTLDIKLDREVDTIPFSTQKVEHVLMNGATVVDVYLAPAIFTRAGESEHVWIARQGKSPYRKDVLEVLAKENLRKKYNLKDGDEVEIEFVHKLEKRRLLNIKLPKMPTRD